MLDTLKDLAQKRLWCPLGRHAGPSGANFCSACGRQLNPDAYRPYRIELNDGTRLRVQAVSTRHARNLVTRGGAPAVDEHTGAPFATGGIHPDNIRSATADHPD